MRCSALHRNGKHTIQIAGDFTDYRHDRTTRTMTRFGPAFRGRIAIDGRPAPDARWRTNLKDGTTTTTTTTTTNYHYLHVVSRDASTSTSTTRTGKVGRYYAAR